MAVVVLYLGEVDLKHGGLVTGTGGWVDYEVDMETYYCFTAWMLIAR